MEDLKRKNGRVLVLVEREGREIVSITFELLAAGKNIADDLEGTLCAAVLGNEIDDVSSEIASFADEVYSLDHTMLGRFLSEVYASALDQLCGKVHFDAVLMGHTLNGVDLAVRLAHKMGVQVITDCIKLVIEPGTRHLLCTKPVYGAKALATFELGKKSYMATIRPKAMEPIKPTDTIGKIIHFDPVLGESILKVELVETIEEKSISLDKAEAIVSGGRGVKNAEGLEKVKELVRVLGESFRKVELGASRPLVDAHLVPSSRQVGLTGEKVAPEIYIAIGISGSLQHVTGISGAKKIIAINTDPEASIFKYADYGIIGNYEDVVPALIKKLEELQ